jgi:hypothetical protein
VAGRAAGGTGGATYSPSPPDAASAMGDGRGPPWRRRGTSSGAHGGWEGGPAATWHVVFFPYPPHE